MEYIRQPRRWVVEERKALETLLEGSSSLQEVHQAGPMERLFRQYRVSWESIHHHPTWLDQWLIDLTGILVEVRLCGNSLLLAAVAGLDNFEQAAAEQKALSMDAKIHRSWTFLPCAPAIDRPRQAPLLQKVDEMHPDAD